MKIKTLFGVLLTVIYTLAANAQDQPPATATETPQTKIIQTDQVKISAELTAKIVEFLKTTSKDAGSLSLPENRIRYQSDAADLLWTRDEKIARDLFANAASDLRSLMQFLDNLNQRREAGEVAEESLGGMFFGGSRGDSGKYETTDVIRQNLLLTLAKRDGNAALALFRETERSNFKAFGWNDEQFEAKLGSIIAKNDPAKALEIGESKLAKNDFKGMDELIENLYRKDATKGAKLASEMAKKAGSAKTSVSYDGSGDPLTALFVKAAKISAESITSTVKPSSDKPVLLSEVELHNLAEAIIKNRLGKVAEDNYYFYDQTGEAKKYLKKYAPIPYAGLERAIKANAKKNGEEIAESVDEPPDLPVAVTAKTEPVTAMSGTTVVLRDTTTEIAGENSVSVAGASGISTRQSAEQAQSAAMLKLTQAAMSPDAKFSLEEARQSLSQIRNRQQRLLALTQIAKMFAARGDKESAVSLLGDAAEMQVAQPRKAAEMLQNLMLADAYSAIEPDRSFAIMESTILEFNSVTAALNRMFEFADIKEIADGEFNMGILPKEAVQSLGSFGLRQPLTNLANADFERTAALADKFDKPELRMEAKMLVVRTLLPPEKED